MRGTMTCTHAGGGEPHPAAGRGPLHARRTAHAHDARSAQHHFDILKQILTVIETAVVA
jgi:hypothetical protein